jgi:hypothetical protein
VSEPTVTAGGGDCNGSTGGGGDEEPAATGTDAEFSLVDEEAASPSPASCNQLGFSLGLGVDAFGGGGTEGVKAGSGVRYAFCCSCVLAAEGAAGKGRRAGVDSFCEEANRCW